DPLVAETELLTDRAGGRQRDELADRELALGEHREHFTANVAGGTNDGDTITHGIALSFLAPTRPPAVAANRFRPLPGREHGPGEKRQTVFVVLVVRPRACTGAARPIRRPITSWMWCIMARPTQSLPRF